MFSLGRYPDCLTIMRRLKVEATHNVPMLIQAVEPVIRNGNSPT
jgi:hypothetical protein